MSNFIYVITFFYSFFLLINESLGQTGATVYSLQDIVNMAAKQSPEALMARHRFKSSFWQFRTYKAEFLPALNLSATLPDLNRSISKVTMPDGSDAFVDRKVINSSADLSLTQNVPFTGGSFFVKSGLQRIDLLTDSNPSSYLSTPISIGYTQPLITFNSYKWQRKIEPLKYEEAKLKYIQSLEDVSSRAVVLFFDYAMAKLNVEIAKVNFSNNDTLFKISKGRYELGKIAENDLLQMEYSLLSSDAQLSRSKIDLEVAKSKLRSFVGIQSDFEFDVTVSSSVPQITVDYKIAKEKADKLNPDFIQFDRQLLESERDVLKAKAESWFNASLYASYGLTQSAIYLKDAYMNPKEQQRVSVGIQVPIIDWGLAKGKYKMALSAQEVMKVNVAQAKTDLEQEIFIKVMNFNIQHKQVAIAAKADTISQNRYEVAKQRYYIGKIDVTDLNIALSDKDVAKRNYISELRNYWTSLFNIRRITLFDFEKNSELNVDFNEIIATE